MHPDTLERFIREHLQSMLAEAEAQRHVPVREPTLRPRLARWLRALAGRLDHLDPAPVGSQPAVNALSDGPAPNVVPARPVPCEASECFRIPEYAGKLSFHSTGVELPAAQRIGRPDHWHPAVQDQE